MIRFAALLLSLVMCSVAVGQQSVYDVRRFGAVGDGTTDDTTAIAAAVSAAVAYQAADGKPAMVFFPRGTYIVQDASTGTDTTPCILIPSTAEDIVLSGYDATLKVGTNGVQTSVIRIEGSRCRVIGLTIDVNAVNAPLDTDTADAYDTKSNTGFEINGSGDEGVEGVDCVIQDCKVINADKGVTTYSTGTIDFDLTGGSSSRLVTISGGTLPGWVNTRCAITISGVRYPIASVLSTTTLTLAADSSTADNCPNGDVTAGTAYTVTGYPTVSQGEEAFVMVQATRSKFVNCHSVDASWQAFRVRGDQNQVIGCSAYNHLGNGLRILPGDEIHIIGFNSYSTRNDGRHAIIADAGSSEDSATDTLADILDDSDVRTKHIYISDCHLECNPDGDFDGAASVLKLAAAYEAHVSKCTIIGGNATNNIGVRVEDCLRLATLEKCYIEPNILFTPAGTSSGSSVYQGSISDHADAGGSLAGYVEYEVDGGAGLVNGKTLFVKGSAIDQYNGPQTILSASSGAIVTDRPYVAGSIGTATYGQSGCDTFKLRDCVIVGMGLSAEGSGAATHYNYGIEGLIAYNVDIENTEIRQKERVNVKMGGILTDYDFDDCLNRFRFVRNKTAFNTDKVCRVIRNTGDDELVTSGKIIAYGNEYRNQHTGTVYLSNPYESTDVTLSYDERAILFSGDGEKPGLYAWTTYPVDSTMDWLAGDYIRNSAPSSGEPVGWTCIVAGSPGTWRPVYATALASVLNVSTDDASAKNLMSYAIPSGLMARTGDRLTLYANVQWFNDSVTKKMRILYDATEMWGTSDVASGVGAKFVIRGEWVRKADATVDWSVTYIEDGTDVGESFAQSGVATTWDAGTTFIIEGDAGAGANAGEIELRSAVLTFTPAP